MSPTPLMSPTSERWQRILTLRTTRDRNLPARAISAALLLLTLYAWLSDHLRPADLWSPHRSANLKRFLTEDALPAPLRAADAHATDLLPWLGNILREHGLEALLITFWISLAATAIASVSAFLAAPLGCRPLFQRDPYAQTPNASTPSRPATWAPAIARTLWVIQRAVPEYVWAFFLLAALGPGVWPAILALAIHNAAILSRLGADTLEDAETPALRALRAGGAPRHALLVHGLWPMTASRFLLYAFYRFETCVREATVLGLLGIVSLGYWVIEARAHQRQDEMIVYILLGAALVLSVELASVWVRRSLRRG